jgi:hypothetical protein
MHEEFIIIKLGLLISDRTDQIKNTLSEDFFFCSPKNVVSEKDRGSNLIPEGMDEICVSVRVWPLSKKKKVRIKREIV